MAESIDARGERLASDCAICHRSVLVGELLAAWLDPRDERTHAVCELCRARAQSRGWAQQGSGELHTSARRRLRVEPHAPAAGAVRSGVDASGFEPASMTGSTLPSAPQLAVLERMAGGGAPVERRLDAPGDGATDALREQMRLQGLELQRLRRELDPARRLEEARTLRRQATEIRDLRAELAERDARIERLAAARLAETSPMQMCGFALDAFNRSSELERMSRIARTLDAPTVNVHDEGPGIPRRVRLTLSWDIAWYEFVVKLDLAAGKASVHQTDTGGDPSRLPVERRRANARWRDSGIVL